MAVASRFFNARMSSAWTDGTASEKDGPSAAVDGGARERSWNDCIRDTGKM
jgi:hypothetical protein